MTAAVKAPVQSDAVKDVAHKTNLKTVGFTIAGIVASIAAVTLAGFAYTRGYLNGVIGQASTILSKGVQLAASNPLYATLTVVGVIGGIALLGFIGKAIYNHVTKNADAAPKAAEAAKDAPKAEDAEAADKAEDKKADKAEKKADDKKADKAEKKADDKKADKAEDKKADKAEKKADKATKADTKDAKPAPKADDASSADEEEVEVKVKTKKPKVDKAAA